MRTVTSTVTVAAGATSPVTSVSTPDDNQIKTLKRVYITPQAAAGTVLTVTRAGFQLEQFDSLLCANGNWPITPDEQWPALILFQYTVQNTSGSSVSPVIVFEYEPGASPGSRPAPSTMSL